MNPRQRILLLILNMTTVSLIVAGIVMILLYRTGFQQQKERLQDIAKSHLSLIRIIESKCEPNLSAQDCQEKILNLFRENSSDAYQLGKTGNIILGKYQGEQIVFLLYSQQESSAIPPSVTRTTKLDQPIQMALAGKSGTMVGLDYRGIKVLAAYEPVSSLGWGIVAKIDVEEINQPFIKAGFSALIVAIFLDIIGVIQAFRISQPLTQELELVNRIMETSPVGIFLINPQGKIIMANEKVAQIIGISREELVNLYSNTPDWHLTTLDGGSIPTQEYPFKQVIENQQPIYDFCCGINFLATEKVGNLVNPKNRQVLISVNAAPLWDKNKELQGAILIIEDITEKVQVEKYQRETEALFKAIFDNSALGIAVVDKKGNLIKSNQALENILGYSNEELAKLNFREFTHTEDLAKDVNNFNKLIAGKQKNFQLEKRYIHKNGSVIWVDLTVSPIRDYQSNFLFAIGMIQDISQRKQVEIALQESEQRFRVLVENIQEAVWLNSAEPSEILYMSPAYEKIFQRSCQSLLDNGSSWLEVVHPDDLQGVLSALKVMKTEGKFAVKYRIIHPDNSIHWIFARTSAIRDLDGKIINHVGIAEDITEPVETLNALEEANKQLREWANLLEKQNQDRILLEYLIGFVQACLNSQEAYHTLGDLIQPLFPNCSGAIFIRDESNDYMEMVASWGDIHSKTNFPSNQCWALRRGKPHNVTENQGNLFCFHVQDFALPAQTICLPMIAKGEAFGLLFLSTQEPGLLDEYKQHLAYILGEQLSISLANLYLQEKLQVESVRDSLTGLFNRRYLEESLKRELDIAKRKNYPVVIMMIDLDHFKYFNDTYNHALGDKVLQAFSKILKSKIRTSDIACRYGGEEFTVILPEVSLEEAKKRAEVFRNEIRKITIEYHQEMISGITASFGIAAFPTHGQTGQDVIHWADIALYEAKEKGRDRIIVAQ